MIPTYSQDHSAATLARWMGMGESSLDAMFPYLTNFEARDLDFMGAQLDNT